VEVYRISQEGFYIEPVILNNGEETPDDCVESKPPNFYKAKWDNGWIEGMSAEEIQEIKNRPLEKSPLEERVESSEMAILSLMDVM
jgi:hypothetical protein